MARPKTINLEENVMLDEVKPSSNESVKHIFKHKTINYSCNMTLPNGIVVEVKEGKVETDNKSIFSILLEIGFVDLTPYRQGEYVVQKPIVEWTFRLANASEDRKINANIGLNVNGQDIQLRMIDNLVTVNEKEIADYLIKNGYILVSSKR